MTENKKEKERKEKEDGEEKKKKDDLVFMQVFLVIPSKEPCPNGMNIEVKKKKKEGSFISYTQCWRNYASSNQHSWLYIQM